MDKKIGGWWRLWIAMSVMYGLIVVGVTIAGWPSGWEKRKLSSEELTGLSAQCSRLLETDPLLADSTPVTIPSYVPAPDERLAALEAKYGIFTEDQLLPNGQYLHFKKAPTNAQIDFVKQDYARLQKASLWKQRRTHMLWALLAWVAPCALVVALSLTIRWVFRGFRSQSA